MNEDKVLNYLNKQNDEINYLIKQNEQLRERYQFLGICIGCFSLLCACAVILWYCNYMGWF